MTITLFGNNACTMVNDNGALQLLIGWHKTWDFPIKWNIKGGNGKWNKRTKTISGVRWCTLEKRQFVYVYENVQQDECLRKDLDENQQKIPWNEKQWINHKPIANIGFYTYL